MSDPSSKVAEGRQILGFVCLALQSKANAFRSTGNASVAEWLESVVDDVEMARDLMGEGYDELLADGLKSGREMVGLALGVALKGCEKDREIP